MASSMTEGSAGQQEQPAPRLQIYSTSDTVSPFWRDKYEREAKKYWDVFYKRHQDRFFKDRHYLDKEWGQYFSGAGQKFILEVGCGAGNTIFPLVATYTDVFVHACDFSPNAVNLVKKHKDFTESRVNAFVCDLTIDDLSQQISPSSVDIVTMIFVLSAVSPEKMSLVVQNIKKILKPSGRVLFRDYATGDLAQERLNCKDQKISENFYARGDGTRAFYFSNEFLTSLFKENGFDVEELDLCCKQVENRSRELVMNRRWVQAVFCLSDNTNSNTNSETAIRIDHPSGQGIEGKMELDVNDNILPKPVNDLEVDMSDSVVAEMFGLPTSTDSDNEVIELKLGGWTFKIKVLSKENQHTCKSTGLMLWESARFMAPVIARNPTIVAGKRVLELGSGCAGICSMIAARSAELVLATDGDTKALDLLVENVMSNLRPPISDKLTTRILEWGNKDHIEAIKQVNSGGFDIILGTDVTYIPDAILPFFQTAKELISSNDQAALILCHIFRRVDEPSILSAASRFGFKLVDKWPVETPITPSQSIINSWFPENGSVEVSRGPLHILYFQKE
ncbi:hypothetical protein ACLB2K_010034 [Fragaria x ananassa]